MEIPDNVSPGEERYFLKPSDDNAPARGEYFLESCWLYRPDEQDRDRLGKRLTTVYDYVAHWEINRGSPDNPEGFDDNVVEDSSELHQIKRFLKQLDEPYRATGSTKINLSATPLPGDQPTTVHASQNIYK